MKRVGYLSLLLAVLIMTVAGCAKPTPRCTSPEDNPQHHYLRGMELIDDGKLDEAAGKFNRAVYCDEKFGPAHAGLAIVYALKAGDKRDPAYRQVDSDKAFEHLKLSWKRSESPEDQFQYWLASLRVYTELKTDDWLDYAVKSYRKAMKLKVDERRLVYYDGREAAPYFMGVAYLEGREFQKARDMFGEVLSMKREGKWNAKADKGWKRVDKIVRAMAGITLGDVGKEIALKEEVARGDMAALLVDEMKIDKLFAGRIPVKSETARLKADFIPADVLNHHFKEEILTLMKWGVRGLEPQYDPVTKANLFKPDRPITRKELAFVLEDVLIKLTGDESLATAFFGHDRSPYPDVPASAAWYNAVMNMTTRSIMETELSGEFRPDDYVDGAEAILAIRVLRQRMNIY
ncbi:MAG TPA: S-layer homology domain-containing protein [Deltaproteobacteria bacterium]|nr:S-layer homology domain-containing protein [Deltaproteobacteria bacterium]